MRKMKETGLYFGRRRRLMSVAAVIVSVVLCAMSGSSVLKAAEGSGKFPSRFDLREQGVVTPVKCQNPFGTCWAFGETAAAETSILSGMGETYESFPIDLSEKHLAWFAVHPVTGSEDPSQAGEGLYPIDEADSYNTGGMPILATSLYASGCGPVTERLFPYQGAEGFTEYEWMLENKEQYMSLNRDTLYERFRKKFPEEEDPDKFAQYCEASYEYALEYYRVMGSYSDKDDWTIAEKPDGNSARLITSGYVLKNGNILPSYQLYDEAKNWTGTNQEAVSAMKRELLCGRAVSISYCADVSLPNEEGNGTYMNYDNYAQYISDAGEIPNHEVTVVGWDDHYAKENFNQDCRPPADGAWIVKNSWGSQTDALPGEAGYGEWGTVNEAGLHTGYFYLSYYDRTICMAETMEFSQSMAIAPDGSFDVYEYDYLASISSFQLENGDVLKTANVFTTDSGVLLRSVATKTAKAGSRVKFEIYALKDDASHPEDGERIASFSTNFEYAGYHRVDLEKEVTLKKGQKFSVVATEYTIGDDGSRIYAATANAANVGEEDVSFYAVGVINPGESYLYANGQWADWSQVSRIYKTDGLELDNFSIKAYAVVKE